MSDSAVGSNCRMYIIIDDPHQIYLSSLWWFIFLPAWCFIPQWDRVRFGFKWNFTINLYLIVWINTYQMIYFEFPANLLVIFMIFFSLFILICNYLVVRVISFPHKRCLFNFFTTHLISFLLFFLAVGMD